MHFRNIFTIFFWLLIIIWLIGIIIMFLPKKTLLLLNLLGIKDKFDWIIGPTWTLISIILFISSWFVIRRYFNNFKTRIRSMPSFVLFLGVVIIFFSSIILKLFGVKIDIQSITSFLSVCVAAWSFYVTNSEKHRNKEESQAAKVSCWLLPESDKDYYEFRNERNKDGGFNFLPRGVSVLNGSQLPIYDIFILSMNSRDDDDTKMLYKKFIYARYIGLLPPGKSICYVKTGGSAMGGVRARAAMIYRDSSYQWWYRGPNGGLSKMEQKEIDDIVNKSGMYYPLFDGCNYGNRFSENENT